MHPRLLLPLLALLCVLPATLATSYVFESDLTTTHTTNGLRYAGANFLSPALLSWGVPVNRVGGDDQTVYNPNTDTSNSDNDFFWANGAPYRPFQQAPAKNQSFVDLMLLNTIKANSTLFLLVPYAQWVANGEPDCGSFPISVYGHQQKEWTKYGNGVYPNGTLLSGDWRCYIPFGLTQTLAWIARLRTLVGPAVFDRHVVLQLENEPDLLGFVHRDIHPAAFSYDELWGQTVTYASTFKRLYPSLRIAGPISYGWCGWWWSELDGCAHNGTDFYSHNKLYHMPFFLSQLEAYYQATGVQLIDILDNHHYPNLPDNDLTPANRAETLDEVRSWYDPKYADPGWIGQCGPRCQGPYPNVIPRYYAWIAKYAPSLDIGLAFSEYSLGFNDSSETGALATLESLAVLGAYNVTWGMRWVSPEPGSLTQEVWRLWFDYDGAGSTMAGEFALTTSTAWPNVTAYSTFDRGTRRLHVLLVSHLESSITCSSGKSDSGVIGQEVAASDDSVLNVPGSMTSTTEAQTWELRPGQWKLAPGPTLTVSMQSDLQVGDAACGMAGRSARLIVVEGVNVTSEVRRVWRPWLDGENEGVEWDQPFAGLGEVEVQRLAEWEGKKKVKMVESRQRVKASWKQAQAQKRRGRTEVVAE